MSKAMDLTGRKFNRLKVIKRIYPNTKYGRVRWLCKCDCEKEKVIPANHLVNNEIKSCGCLVKEEMINNPHNKLAFGTSNMRQAILTYKMSAKRRGVEYKLTVEQFKEITQKDCFYCGAKPSNIYKNKQSNGKYIYNGIDRIDNNKGYAIDNIVPCCKSCNSAKGILTLQEFQDWVKRLYNNMFEQKK